MTTTTKLLTSIKRKAYIPDGQVTFSDADILEIADEEIQSILLPEIISVREEYFTYSEDFTYAASLNIPYRAIGMQVRDVHIVCNDTIISDFPMLEIERLANSNIEGFYLKNNNIIINLANTTDKTVRIYYPIRPSKLVPVAEAGQITAINGSVLTCSSVPSDWTTETLDLIKQDGGHECLAIDLTGTASGSDITLTTTPPSSLRVGDWIALQGESPLIQLPKDYFGVLAQGVAASLMEIRGEAGAAMAVAKYKALRESALKLLTPRVQGQERIIVANPWNI